jgi:hypothetical protein
MVDDGLMIDESAVMPNSDFFLGSQYPSTSPGSPAGDVMPEPVHVHHLH